ncbi:MAG: FtsX-like permease family protein [Ilumatobacteraceae bacterium]|nr:MAG: FtsX-like permease family protein [Actinomycetota bacterium]
MIGTITRKSLRARWGRSLFIGLAILLGVAFVSGSFVLADSLKATFDNLFSRLNEDVDLEVRSSLAFDDVDAQRDPIPAELVDVVSSVPGVGRVEPLLTRYAQLLDPDGEPVVTQGAPMFGASWTGESGLGGMVLKDGVEPQGSDQTAIDKATADRIGFEVGDEIKIIFDTGPHTFTIVGLIGLGNADGFGGATIAAFDPATAQEVLGSVGTFDAIDVQVAEGEDAAVVAERIGDVLPPRVEVVSGEQVAEENSDAINQFIGVFGTGLLVFAFITAFVSAFIINNVFGITISQRLRELALLRAVGASGRQVRRMILVEALLISITATVLGILAGIGVARGLIAIFDAAGAGFPPAALVMKPRTVAVAFLVGVGITLVSVLLPARRAARIPPVAAMRPEIGFGALTSNRRLVVGGIATVVGAVMFLVGIFLRPGGTPGLIALAGGGAVAVFVGVAGLSAVVARPVTRALGWPIAKAFHVPGRLARENAGRVPRRTARTASALMIGVALVSAAAVFASSLRDTFGRVLDRSVTADFIITDKSFQGLPPALAGRLATLPELAAVSPVRGIAAEVDGDVKAFGAIDPTGFAGLADIGLVEGSYDALTEGGVFVHEGPADDLDLALGDPLDVVYQNGVEATLTVAGIFDDASLVGNWLISISTMESVTNVPPRDFFVIARLADGVEPAEGRAAVDAAIVQFPQAKLQSNAEFRAEQEGQINQLLAIITALLGMAIVIAVIGIAITLALSVLERTREIGLMRAVGMSRRQLRRTVRWESVIVSVFGALVGVVVGLLFGVALSIAVPETVIDGITFPTTMVIIVLIGAVVAGVLAGWWPSRRAAKMNILEAIATE